MAGVPLEAESARGTPTESPIKPAERNSSVFDQHLWMWPAALIGGLSVGGAMFGSTFSTVALAFMASLLALAFGRAVWPEAVTRWPVFMSLAVGVVAWLALGFQAARVFPSTGGSSAVTTPTSNSGPAATRGRCEVAWSLERKPSLLVSGTGVISGLPPDASVTAQISVQGGRVQARNVTIANDKGVAQVAVTATLPADADEPRLSASARRSGEELIMCVP